MDENSAKLTAELLANLSPEVLKELQSLIDKKPKATAELHSADERRYWRVSSGAFECWIDRRDANTPERAREVAFERLTPWYAKEKEYVSLVQSIAGVEEVKHKDFVNWLRR